MQKLVVLDSISRLRAEIHSVKLSGRSIGFVPTMGSLHAGHLSLMALARKEADYAIASIFVNPAQFNNHEDYLKYTTDIPRDLELLEKSKIDAVFIPKVEEIYGVDFESWVGLDNLPSLHEGASRPGHFRGVSTVVSILFNLVQPNLAVFGEKDFQQLLIIEKLVQDLKFNIKIIRGPVLREEGGLAMSSRNVRLSAAARKVACELSHALFLIEEAARKGESDCTKLQSLGIKHLALFPMIKVDYLEVVSEKNLAKLASLSEAGRLLIAAEVDGVRLIDNIRLAF